MRFLTSQIRHAGFGLAAAAVFTFVLAGCGGSKPISKPIPPVTVNFNVQSSTGGLLPEAVVDTPYAYGFQTNAGAPGVNATLPVVFSNTHPLPPGLTLTSGGVLAGTPTQAGIFSVAIQAVDSSAPQPQTAAFTYLLDIRLPGVTLTQIAHSDLGGHGQNAAVRVAQSTLSGISYAYVGTRGTAGECPATGVKIVDLSSISNPTVVATAGGIPGASQANVRIATGVSSPFFHPGASGDMMAVTEQPCNPANANTSQEGVEFFDVSNPANPQELGSWSSGLDGTDDVAIVAVPGPTNAIGLIDHSQDKMYALVAVPGSETSPAGNGQGDLRVLDITNPAAPRQIGQWGVLTATDTQLAQAVMGNDPRVFLASINLSSNGKIAYLGYWDEGVVVLDVSDPTQIATNNPAIFLDHITYPITRLASTSEPALPEGNTRVALPVDGDTGLLIADQVCASAMQTGPADSQSTPTNPAVALTCGPPVPLTLNSGWGFVRTYSLGANGAATLESFFADPQSMSAPAPDDGIYTAHDLAWNGDTSHPHAYVAWYSAGIEDLDISSLTPPTRLASFIPPDTPDPNGNNPAINNPPKALVDGVAAYNNGGNHYILASDMNSGLWIVQETPVSRLTILTTTLPDGNVGVPYNARLAAVNGALGDSRISFSLAPDSLPMPSGLTLHSDGTITGTPLVSGSVLVNFQATDGTGNTTLQSVQMTIDQTLAIPPVSTTLGTTNEAFRLALSAVNGKQPFSWSVVQGSLPRGINLDPTSGLISGTGAVSGTFTATIQVTDSSIPVASATLPVTIQLAGLTPQSTSVPNPLVGASYTAIVTMNNGTGPFTPTLVQGTLPPGITAEKSISSTEEWLFTGTPTQAGTYHFSLLITDADGQSVTLPFTITVEPFALLPPVLPIGVENQGYLQQLTAQGGTSPYKFQLVLGTLPSGLSMNENGFIFGKPVSGTAGTDTFTVTATDTNGLTAVRAYTLTIFNPAFLAITTVALAPGTAGQPYNQPITADFGTAPYTFTVLSGNLPSGVSLTPAGVLSGVPGNDGSFAFTVQVKDATGATASAHLTWTINPSAP